MYLNLFRGTLPLKGKKDLKLCLIFFSAVIGFVLLEESYPNETLWGVIILTVIVFFVFIIDWPELWSVLKSPKKSKEEDKEPGRLG